MRVYRVEMVMATTAFIKADSADKAREKAFALAGKVVRLDAGEIPVSEDDFDSEDLPDVSLSPVAVCSSPAHPVEPEVVHVLDS